MCDDSLLLKFRRFDGLKFDDKGVIIYYGLISFFYFFDGLGYILLSVDGEMECDCDESK